jgi:hypothetical protein
MKRPLLFLNAGLTLLTGTAASAGLILVQGSFRVTEGAIGPELFGQLFPGDTFGFSFAYDDSVTDSSSGPSQGLFTNAVLTGGTFQKFSGPGSWSPGAGNLTAGAVTTTNDIGGFLGNSDGVTFYSGASGFASAGDYSFGQLHIPLGRTDLSTVLDTGAGQTLSEQLSGETANSLTWISGPASLDFYHPGGPPRVLFQAAFGTVTLAVIPEPSTGLFVLPGLAVAVRRRR